MVDILTHLIAEEELKSISFYKPIWFSIGIYEGLIFFFLLFALFAFLILIYLSVKD